MNERRFVRRSFRALLAVACLLLGACNVRVGVAVDTRGDGSGSVRATVTLDKAAADAVRQRVPDIAAELRKSDLTATGWKVVGPTVGRDGSVVITATKGFANPAQAAAVVAQLSGPSEPFQHFTVTRRASFASVRTRLTGTVDLRSGLNGFGDPTLQQQLGGSAIGLDPAQLKQQLGVDLDQVFDFTVTARLPGHRPQTWTPTLGNRIDLLATSRQWQVRNLVLLAVTVAAGLGLLSLALFHALARK